MNRTFLAALLGGLIVFMWGALSHTVLPLGHMGISSAEVGTETEAVAFLTAKFPESGTYFMPDMERVPKEQWPASGPTAFLVWRPDTPYTMGKHMAIEFTSNVLAALLAAMLLCCGSLCSTKLLCRATAVMGLGVFAWLSISVSQWNWYGFSTGQMIGEGLDQAIGWFLAGLGMAAILKPKAA
jgi:hypothetical protein